MSAQAIAVAISWPGTLAIARLLSPEDYGFLAMTTVLTRLVSILAEAGLGMMVVIDQDESDSRTIEYHGTALWLGLVAMAIVLAAAWPLGSFYNAPETVPVTAVLSATFVISAPAVVPTALLRKRRQFDRLAQQNLIRVVVDIGTTLIVAMLGGRYWSLVAGAAFGNLASTITANVFAPLPPRLSSPSQAWLVLKRSRDFLGQSVFHFGLQSADLVVAGRLLGASALGTYQLAMNISTIPSTKIAPVLIRNAPALLAPLAGSRDRLSQEVSKMFRLLGILILPSSFGLAAVAEPLVLAALGPKWSEAVTPVIWISLLLPLQVFTSALATALSAVGEAARVARNTAGQAAFVAISCALGGLLGGLTGLVIAWALSVPAAQLPLLRGVNEVLGVTVLQLMALLARPFLCAAAMASAVWLTQQSGWLAEVHVLTQTALLVTLGAAAYSGLALLVLPQERRWMLTRFSLFGTSSPKGR